MDSYEQFTKENNELVQQLRDAEREHNKDETLRIAIEIRRHYEEFFKTNQ